MPTLTSTGAVNLTSSTNWSPAQIPATGDDLIIQGHTLTLDADMTLNSVTINNANSRLAISGTTRSVQATNGWIVAAQPGSTLISGALAAGTSVTLTGTWSGGAGLVNAIATSTGGNLTLQTVGASQSEVLFADVVGNIARSITSSWSGGSLTTIGRFSLGSWTAAISIVTMTGGTWSHQSSGTNSFGAGGHRLANVSGTATVNWTGSIDSQSNISNSGLFFLGSSSTSHTIGQSGDVFLLRNATTSAGGLTTIIYLQSGVVELVGQFTQRGDAQLIYSFFSGTMRWRNQSQSIPSTDTCIIHAIAGTIDLSGLVLTNAGKFVLLEYGSGATTVTAGTSITCTSTAATACAWGTTVLDGRIVVLESSPATLPTNAQVASGVSYGYSGAPQTGTGLIMDPATLATAMITSFSSLPEVMVRTTIATLASQTSFTLTAGSADDDVYNGLTAVITDQSTSVQKAVATISDYVGSTRTVTLSAAPGFTIATGDSISIIAGSSSGGGGSFPSEAPANWIKAAGIQDGAFTAEKFGASAISGQAVASVTGNVGGNVTGSVGSISGVTFPSNFGSMSITVGGAVTAGTVSDKTGYSLTPTTGLGNQTANITGNLSGSVGSVSSGVTVTTNNDKTGYSLTAGTGLGNQTANITGNLSGSVGSVSGNVGGNVVGSVGSVASGVTVTTNNDKTGYSLATAPPTAAAIADAVWDEARTGHTTAGTFGFYLDAAISGISGGGGGSTAADIWAYATRTLTSTLTITTDDIDAIVAGVTAAGPGLYNVVRNDDLTLRIGDEFEQSITGLGNLTGNSDIVFTLKAAESDADTAAKVYLSKNSGLTRLNGAVYGTPANGTITVDDEVNGDITIRISSAATASLTKATRVDAVKVLQSGGNDRTPRVGRTQVLPVVVEARG